ncbi:MAG: hypothetical protein WCR27_05370 [Eubacteriales bacterium]
MLEELKFKESEFEGKSSSDLPDRPSEGGMSAQDLKSYFDMIPKVMIALGKFNELINFLKSEDAASEIGVNVEGLMQNDVESILSKFNTEITNRYTKTENNTLISENTSLLVKDVNVDLSTGIITVIKKDGTTKSYDTAIEKVPALFEFIEEQDDYFIKITNVDGSTSKTKVTELMNQYAFLDDENIDFTVDGEGPEKSVSANIKSNSIGIEKLKLEAVSLIENYAASALESKDAAGSSETSAAASKEAAISAKNIAEEKATICVNSATQAINSAEVAESAAARAESFTGDGFATLENLQQETNFRKFIEGVLQEDIDSRAPINNPNFTGEPKTEGNIIYNESNITISTLEPTETLAEGHIHMTYE